jgi:threonine synthase
MLYVSTRNHRDAFTAAHAFQKNTATDGGRFVPFRVPEIPGDEILALGEKSFGQIASRMLNLFYGCKLLPWDVDFAVGRNPVRSISMSHRLIIGEVWLNLDRDLEPMLNRLNRLAMSQEDATISAWGHIALRITILFGLMGELSRNGSVDLREQTDIALPCGNFEWIMAAWYAKKMGLPIGTIICACNDNGAGWDLLHQGQLHTDAVVKQTNTPLADFAVPEGMECLIHGVLGTDEVLRFAEKNAKGRLYSLDEAQLSALREGMYSAVISSSRVSANILSLYRTGNYIASPYTALAYSGLMDYRARTGESRTTLLLGPHSPEHDADTVSEALGITVDQLAEKMR